MSFFKKNRISTFPWIKDFKDPQNALRHANVNDLTYGKWFWFHPSAYKLIKIGVPACAALNILIFSLFVKFDYINFFKYKLLILVILYFFIAFFVYRLVCVIKECEYEKETNFYDILVRDSEVD